MSLVMLTIIIGQYFRVVQVDVSGNITNYWEDEGETKSRQVGNMRNLQAGSTKELGDAVFFVERGGIVIPLSEYTRQNGFSEVWLLLLQPL